MPFRYTIYPEHRLCVVHLEGVIEGDDMVEAISSVFEDARMKPDYHILWMASSISQLILDERAFGMLRETVAHYLLPFRSSGRMPWMRIWIILSAEGRRPWARSSRTNAVLTP